MTKKSNGFRDAYQLFRFNSSSLFTYPTPLCHFEGMEMTEKSNGFGGIYQLFRFLTLAFARFEMTE